MNFVSYAQNFEDVILWRALKNIQHGFYVDVGAQHPVVDSVSKGFYEQGWRGIHIEPVPQWAALLRQDRPDETVLELAIGERSGTLELDVIPDTGLSTAVHAHSERHLAERGFLHQPIRVPCLTLDDALRDLVTKREIHWLKIDVEGLEEAVFTGWNADTIRPWIIVVEATVPGSQEPDYAVWEPLLTGAGYTFVYFDGLNRFYVAVEHAELVHALAVPPNVFDNVELSGMATSAWCGLVNRQRMQAEARETVQRQQWLDTEREIKAQTAAQLEESKQRLAEARVKVERLHNEWQTAQARIDELNHANHHWRSTAEQLHAELCRVYASKSWFVTAPLRHTMRLGKRLMKPAVLVTMVWVLKHGRIKAALLNVIAHFPRLNTRLRAMALHHGTLQPPAHQPQTQLVQAAPPDAWPPGNPAGPLPARAGQLYALLRRARASHAHQSREVR